MNIRSIFLALCFVSAIEASQKVRMGGCTKWKCVFSAADNGSLWVTSTGPNGPYACAGPDHNHCYWFAGSECSQLVTSTDLVGKLCCCGTEGWCQLAKDVFNSKTQTTLTLAQETIQGTIQETVTQDTVQETTWEQTTTEDIISATLI